MGKIVDSDQYTDNLIAALRSRGVEIPDELLQAASTEASDNTDEVENDDESDYLDPEWGDDDPAGPLADGTFFADPGGTSALRAATRGNPRNLPCPTCGEPDRLTPADKARGYQCDTCAERAEGHGY